MQKIDPRHQKVMIAIVDMLNDDVLLMCEMAFGVLGPWLISPLVTLREHENECLQNFATFALGQAAPDIEGLRFRGYSGSRNRSFSL